MQDTALSELLHRSKIPVAGLDPAIHAFFRYSAGRRKDVGVRIKSGQEMENGQ